MSDYRLQVYTPDLREQVCKVQTHMWGSSISLNDAYLDWKYLRNPYVEKPLIYVALHNDRVVGMRAMFGTCWEAGDYKEKLVLPSAADTVIAPEHRDRGLFQELTGFVLDDLGRRGYSHALNLSPSSYNYVTSVMNMGWRPMGSSEALSRGNPPDSRVANVIHSASRYSIARKVLGVSRTAARSVFRHSSIARKVLGVSTTARRKIMTAMRGSAFSDLDRNARDHRHPVSLSREPRPKAMADLVQQLGGDGRIRQVRDHTFFSWRFGNPRACYRFLFRGGEDLDGYMVLQKVAGIEQVNIVDWEGRNPRVLSDLLEAAINWGQFRVMGTWGTGLSSSVIEMLQKAGFSYVHAAADSPDRYAGLFLLKPLDQDAETGNILGYHPLEQNNWDLRRIYSDGE